MELPWKLNARLRPVRRLWRRIHVYVPELNFITIHYIYFIITILVTSVVFWGSSSPPRSVRFIDAIFLTTSAMTEAGLNTVNLSTLNTWQQIILFFLIMIGSAIFVSAFVVHVRRRAFEIRFRNEVETEMRISGRSTWFPLTKIRTAREPPPTPSKDDPVDTIGANFDQAGIRRRSVAGIMSRVESGNSGQRATPTTATQVQQHPSVRIGDVESAVLSYDRKAPLPPTSSSYAGTAITFDLNSSGERRPRQTPHTEEESRSHFWRRTLTPSGVGARSSTSRVSLQLAARGSVDLSRSLTDDRRSAYLGETGYVSRNSNFHELTAADRLRLGGTEYKAVVFLSWIVPIYFVVWQLLGCLALGAYVNTFYAQTTLANGLNPWWTGAFNAVSAFNNSGMSLLDANMIAFSDSVYMLLSMSLFIFAGNTCYPVFLRLAVWSIRKVLPNNEAWCDARHTLQFLLDHPRRCYTNLFPSTHTWWLFSSVVVLNGIDCAAYAILNIGNKAITHTSAGIEFVDGLFQASAVRAGGFYVVPISSVRVSLQVLYVIMMYISAFPVAITMRNSNVYEERSLGIYADDPGFADELREQREKFPPFGFAKRLLGHGVPEATGQFVQQQLRAQLSHDIWMLALAVFLIMIIEGGQFEADPAVFSVFNVIFEVVSAYGTVGISIGLPNEAYSFCGAWHTLSKLILCVVMIRGRHRGLPVAIDKAVMLPREQSVNVEETYANEARQQCEPPQMDPPNLNKGDDGGRAA